MNSFFVVWGFGVQDIVFNYSLNESNNTFS